MTSFSTLHSKIEALGKLVAKDSISPTYLASLLDEIIFQMEAIDMSSMRNDISNAVINAKEALKKASDAVAAATQSAQEANFAKSIALGVDRAVKDLKYVVDAFNQQCSNNQNDTWARFDQVDAAVDDARGRINDNTDAIVGLVDAEGEFRDRLNALDKGFKIVRNANVNTITTDGCYFDAGISPYVLIVSSRILPIPEGGPVPEYPYLYIQFRFTSAGLTFRNGRAAKKGGLVLWDEWKPVGRDVSAELEALQKSVDSNKAAIERLLGENASEAIENFNEILEFLKGISDSESLDALLTELNTRLCDIEDAGIGQAAQINANTTALLDKADRTELPNVVAVAPLDGFELPELPAYQRLFVELWNEACGADGHYNADTGFFELNGLTDITYAQAVAIMAAGQMAVGATYNGFYSSKDIRTHLPVRGGYGWADGSYVFTACRNLESVNMKNWRVGMLSFLQCRKLRSIHITSPNVLAESGQFRECAALETLVVERVDSFPFDLSGCPLLSMESVRGLVSAKNNTSQVSVTVHRDVFARLGDELIAAAAEKNITFTTA